MAEWNAHHHEAADRGLAGRPHPLPAARRDHRLPGFCREMRRYAGMEHVDIAHLLEDQA